MNLNSRGGIFTKCKGYANDLWLNVNTLAVADFNRFLYAIQGDTHWFVLIEWFVKVRNLL